MKKELAIPLPMIEEVENRLRVCQHPYAIQAGIDWCNLCGARRITLKTWIHPHVQDLLLQ